MENSSFNSNGFNNLIKGKNGYCLYNKNDIYIGKSIEKYGEFSELEADLFRQICKENDTVIEVGANIGTHTQIFSKLVGDFGKVLAFEPQRIVFQTLCANMALNSISNVYTYQMALSSENGYLNIPDLDYSKKNNYGGISMENIKKGSRVPKLKLDGFINEINNLKLIKIDVEGMESDVILGAKDLLKNFRPFLYVENDRRDKSKELIELISSLGYKMYWHLPRLYNKDNFFEDKENIFGNILSVNMLCIHESLEVNVVDMMEVEDSSFHPMKK